MTLSLTINATLKRLSPLPILIVHGPGIETLPEILHMLVSMGSTALAAAVVLPRYGGLNYACGVNED